MRILVVDAFTDRPFGGNPAGVVLLRGPADPAWMQRVAAEMRHSETAFVHTDDGRSGEWALRWFTPVTEVALCGHATLATAHALYETGWAAPDRPIRFQTRHSGVLSVDRHGEALRMDFPALPSAPLDGSDGDGTAAELTRTLSDALGAAVLDLRRSTQNDLLAEVADAATVRRLAVDTAALRAVDARGVIVTALGDGGHHDFVSRFFAPRTLGGDGEDPVTGSAHCALAPYWAARLGRDTLTGYQASARGGTVGTRLVGDRVELTGRAVTVLDGELRV